jgi:predicted O-methyltransferase YrrM
VLIDLWKDMYIPFFDAVYPRLAPGAILVADNMIHPAAVRPLAQAYRSHVRAAAGMSSVLLPLGSGIEVSRLRVP